MWGQKETNVENLRRKSFGKGIKVPEEGFDNSWCDQLIENFPKDIPISDGGYCFYQSLYPICLQYWQQPLDIRVPIVVISCLPVPLVAMMFLLQGRISSDFNEEVFALGLTEEKQLEQNPRDQVHVQCTFFQCEHKLRKTDLLLGRPAVCDSMAD